MSWVYIGTDGFAADVLERLAAAGSPPDLVISRPDSRKGRGRRSGPPPTAVAAAGLGIDLLQPVDVGSGEVADAIDAIDPPALALCAYGAIIGEPLLSRRPILNLHPSLLPRWRGAAPIERSIMAGDPVTGVSIIRLVSELDAGPIALAGEVPIAPLDDAGTLAAKLSAEGAKLLLTALGAADAGELVFTPQATEGVTYAERITAEDRMIDTKSPVAAAERLVRALRPRIGARLRLPSGEVLGVRSARITDREVRSGEIDSTGGGLFVGFPDGVLEVTRIVPPGGKEMATADWLRGRRP